jgi:hypothetical protein
MARQARLQDFGQKTRGGFYGFDGIVAGRDPCKTGKSEEKGKTSKQQR